MALLRTARIAGGEMPQTVRTDGPKLRTTGKAASSEMVYVCPAGVRTVIRNVDIIASGELGAPMPTSETADAAVWKQVGIGEWTGFEFMHEFWNGRYQAQWRGHLVMYEGEELWIYVGVPFIAAYYHASGAVLPIP